MSTTLAVALVVPWVFWGVLMGLLIAGGRSWINMLLIPVCITVVILAIASLSSVRDAFLGFSHPASFSVCLLSGILRLLRA